MNGRVIQIGFAIRLAVAAIGLTAALFAVWACVNLQMIYAAVGLAALFLVLSPLLFVVEYDLFSPWTVLAGSFAALMTPQTIAMSFSLPDEVLVDQILILGQGPEYFIYPGAILLLSIVCMICGYFGFTQTNRGRQIRLGRALDTQRTLIVLSLVCVFSVISTVSFVQVTGGFKSAKISDKRTKLETLEVERADSRQYGHLRQLAKLSTTVFLIFFSYVLTRRERSSLMITVLVIGSGLIAAALPFYASSREQVGWIVIHALGVSYYLGSWKALPYRIAGLITVGLVALLFMTTVRNTSDDSVREVSISKFFEAMFLNRNGPGLAKTAHIINGIPDKLDYKYGKTIAVWLIAPVPRAVFPGKPMIASGPEIGTKIFGTKLSGVPPGLIAELYWNFHIAGVIFGTTLLGFILRRVYEFFRDMRGELAIIIPAYLFAVLPAGFGVLGNSLGYGTVMRLVDFVTIFVVLWLCSRPIEIHQPANYVLPSGMNQSARHEANR